MNKRHNRENWIYNDIIFTDNNLVKKLSIGSKPLQKSTKYIFIVFIFYLEKSNITHIYNILHLTLNQQHLLLANNIDF